MTEMGKVFASVVGSLSIDFDDEKSLLGKFVHVAMPWRKFLADEMPVWPCVDILDNWILFVWIKMGGFE